MPSPGPSPHELEASPRLPSSLTRPSASTGLVPAPPAGNGRTTTSWTIIPAFQTRNETVPTPTTEGVVEMPIIRPPGIMPPPIIPPLSERTTSTVWPDSAGTSQVGPPRTAPRGAQRAGIEREPGRAAKAQAVPITPTRPTAIRTNPRRRRSTASSPLGQGASALLVLVPVELAASEALVEDVERSVATGSGGHPPSVGEGSNHEHDPHDDQREEHEHHEHHPEAPNAVPGSVHHVRSPPCRIHSRLTPRRTRRLPNDEPCSEQMPREGWPRGRADHEVRPGRS